MCKALLLSSLEYIDQGEGLEVLNCRVVFGIIPDVDNISCTIQTMFSCYILVSFPFRSVALLLELIGNLVES